MFKKITPLLVVFLLCFGTQIHAQSQAEMNIASMEKYQEADAELNKVYKELMKLLDADEKKLLIKAQKDWIKLRDSHCQFVIHEYEGGSIQPLIANTCFEDQTRKRTAELKAILEERQSR